MADVVAFDVDESAEGRSRGRRSGKATAAEKAPAVVEDKIAKARDLLTGVRDLLSAELKTLTEKERQRVPRTRGGFVAAARQLLRATVNRPALLAGASVDPQAVAADLDKAEGLLPLIEVVDQIVQILADGRLQSLAAAYKPALAIYGMAKIGARKDGDLKAVVDALASIFPGHPRAKKATA
jgi:hypothetical protein